METLLFNKHTNETSEIENVSPVDELKDEQISVETKDLNFYYGPEAQALFLVNLRIPKKRVTAFIGPSGCGKSTLLRCFNRMNDLIPGTFIEGKVYVEGEDIYHEEMRLEVLRKKVGMVFQKSNPFPKTIFENVAYGPRIHGLKDRAQLEAIVESTLRKSALWDEVKDRLNTNALDLSGGQQQRLCIARALAVDPEILLMDEPASALDPRSTARIEDLIAELRHEYTIVIVTHNMQQASRVSDYTAFMYEGNLIEFDRTRQIFTRPSEQQTEDYITGRFG